MEEQERNYADECGDHGGTNRRGQPCGRAAGWGTDYDSGKCKNHRGTSPDGSSHEGNGNAETHGLTADAEKWFNRHRDEVEDDVQLLVESWMDRAPFGWEDHGNVWLLTECAVDEVRMREANEYVDEEGLVVEHYDGHDPISERPIHEFKENPALRPKSRMKKDTVRTLKDLGIIGGDDTTVEVNVHEELLSGLKAAHGED